MDCVQYPQWQWAQVDGAQLHAVYPYVGRRTSIVLFTHDAVLGSLPPELHQKASALGLASRADAALAANGPAPRDYSHLKDWPLAQALTEQAEATLHVANMPYNEICDTVRENCLPCAPKSPATPAAVLPARLLAFVLLACQAARSTAAQTQRTFGGLVPRTGVPTPRLCVPPSRAISEVTASHCLSALTPPFVPSQMMEQPPCQDGPFVQPPTSPQCSPIRPVPMAHAVASRLLRSSGPFRVLTGDAPCW